MQDLMREYWSIPKASKGRIAPGEVRWVKASSLPSPGERALVDGCLCVVLPGQKDNAFLVRRIDVTL